MKVIILLTVTLAVALAAPQISHDKDAVVLKSDSDNIGLDSYKYGYETSNGIAAEEEGHLLNPNTDAESMAVRGSFSYTGDDGKQYAVQYTADENGFQAVGEHIPK